MDTNITLAREREEGGSGKSRDKIIDEIIDHILPVTKGEIFDTHNEARRLELRNTLKANSISAEQIASYMESSKNLFTKIKITGFQSFYYFIEFIKVVNTLEKVQAYQRALDELNHIPENGLGMTLQRAFIDISGIQSSHRPNRAPEKIVELFKCYGDIYTYLQSLPVDHIFHTQRKNEWGSIDSIYQYLQKTLFSIAISTDSVLRISRVLECIKKIDQSKNLEALSIFIRSLIHYARNHDLDENAVTGFTEKFFRELDQHEDTMAVNILSRESNMWSIEPGGFGIADLACHTYTKEVNPANISKLMIASKEIPTTNFARFEQNRKDGLSLIDPFGALRDFIHDQRPYVHEVITEMVRFYETGDFARLRSIVQHVPYLNQPDRIAALTNPDNYTVNAQNGESVKTVLERLKNNTKTVLDDPTLTSENELNELVTQLHTSKGRDAEIALGPVLAKMNALLENMMKKKQIGIDYEYILLINWIERKCFQMLQKVNYEQQREMYKGNLFWEIFRFHELTSSAKEFNSEEFETFKKNMQSENDYRKAYKSIIDRLTYATFDLAQKYINEGRKDTGFLWSGNIAHEIMTLVDDRKPTTEIGRRIVYEKETQKTEPFFHSGD